MGSTPILPFEYNQLRITPGALENDVTDEPGLGAVVGAAFRLENPIRAMWSYDGPSDMERLQKEEGYDSWTNVKGTWREPFFERYSGVFNTKAQLSLDAQIQRELEDRRTLHASGWPAYLTGLGVATLTDPTNLMPGGVFVRGAKVARAVGKGFVSGAAAGATAVGASELVLQNATETRTGVESVFSIGGGALLMGMVGATVSGVLTRAEVQGATRYLEELTRAERAPGEEAGEEALAALRAELTAAGAPVRAGAPPAVGAPAPVGGPLRAGAAGAEARVEATLDDLTMAGGPITRGLVGVTKWNPIGRNLTRTSAVARGVISRMIENPFIMRMHRERGRGPGTAVRPAGREPWCGTGRTRSPPKSSTFSRRLSGLSQGRRHAALQGVWRARLRWAAFTGPARRPVHRQGGGVCPRQAAQSAARQGGEHLPGRRHAHAAGRRPRRQCRQLLHRDVEAARHRGERRARFQGKLRPEDRATCWKKPSRGQDGRAIRRSVRRRERSTISAPPLTNTCSGWAISVSSSTR